MTVYTKSFNLKDDNFSIKKIVNYGSNQIAFGESKNGIVIFKYDENATTINTKEIIYENNNLAFCDVIFNKHIILVAKSKPAKGSIYNLHFLDIRMDGSINIQNKLNLKQGITEVLSFIQLNSDYFILIETPPVIASRGSEQKEYYYLKINKELQVLQLNKLENKAGAQYKGAIVNDTNVVLFGKRTGTKANSGLLTLLNSSLETVTSFVAQEASAIDGFDYAINHAKEGLILFGNSTVKNIRFEKPQLVAAHLYVDSNRVKVTLSKIYPTNQEVTKSVNQGENYLSVTLNNDKKNNIMVFDKNLKNIDQQGSDLKNNQLTNLTVSENNIQILGSYIDASLHLSAGLLISMTDKYETCEQKKLPLIKDTSFNLKFDKLEAGSVSSTITTSKEAFLKNTNSSITTIYICERPIIIPVTNEPYSERPFKSSADVLLQSPHLNLQTAGSGTDTLVDSAKGVHLRWFLTGGLEKHIPKGNLATTTTFLNKPNDFVDVYRVPYTVDNTWTIQLDFKRDEPSSIHNNTWTYKKSINGHEKTLSLEFDQSQYNTSKLGIPSTQIIQRREEILKNYGTQPVKLSVTNELLFSVQFNSKAKLETFSPAKKESINGVRGKRISLRKIMDPNEQVFSENIVLIRFSTTDLSKIAIAVESYSDIIARNKNMSTYMGSFALETDTTKSLSRLENENVKIDGVWNKFDDNQKVKTENYKKRWSDADFGIKINVEKYIALSNISQRALEMYAESSNPDSKMEVSFLDMVKVASLDFHNARMLGLGNIDIKVGSDQKFIYFVEYITEKSLEDPLYNTLKRMQHLYFSLPTGLEDKRLPQNIVLQDVSYGLKIDNGTNEPLYITDKDGYAYKQNTRYVNLKTTLKEDYSMSQSFFQPATEFESSKFSTPVFIGFKRRKSGSNQWPKPDLIHEQENYFSDSGNTISENSVTLFDPQEVDKPDYTDTIVSENIDAKYKHEYVAYSINVFSRTSALSNIQTVVSEFKKDNSLKPPSNLNAHLIQEESVPMFSTAEEQGWLQNIQGDKTLVRLLFDYNHIQEKNYDYAKKIRIFHRVFPIKNIIGGLILPPQSETERDCIVKTKPFKYSSGEVHTPVIKEEEKQKFIGSFLTYNSQKFEVIDIITTTSGELPQIKLQKNEVKSAVYKDDGTYQLKQDFEAPILDYTNSDAAAFLLVENLTKPQNWANPNSIGSKLHFEIDLENETFESRSEIYLDEENNPNTITVRGIWDDCKVEHKVSGDKAHYVITFNKNLPNHPQFVNPEFSGKQPSVNWFKGQVRIHSRNDMNLDRDKRKARKVLKIDQMMNVGTSQKLVLIAHDPDYKKGEQASLSSGDRVSINFYPSYQVYLWEDPSTTFNESNILPLSNENEHSTLIGMQTIDSDNGYVSSMGVPAPLISHRQIKLNKPEKPVGPLFATPPNYYGKAKYTFNTKFKEKPWAVVFFRADINRILSVLYTRDTLTNQILPKVLPITEDEFFINRWQNLLSVDCDPEGKFTTYHDQFGNDFAFPAPDNDRFGFNPGLTIGSTEWKEHIKLMISSCMLPLTENPIIYEFIKGDKEEDKNYVPTSKKQTLRGSDGKILHPTDKEFDIAPMAKKISDLEIQFTDFTLEGDMHNNTAYVYVVKEMNMSLNFGKPSEFLGPVQLINTTPPEPLILNKINVRTPSFLNGFMPGIAFELNKVRESQNISKILIYRFENSLDALNSRGLKPVKEINLSAIDTTKSTFIIEDDFSDGSPIPYGKPIYYNLVAVRKISYSKGEGLLKEELVYSKPSRTIVTNIMDVRKPRKPQITYTFTEQNNTIVNLQFSIHKCCQDGKYSIFYLNTSHNWEEIKSTKNNEETILINVEDTRDFVKLNKDGDLVYHKFKVVVENTIGIRNESEVYTL